MQESKDSRIVDANISAFHYYHKNVFLENLKLIVEIFCVEVLLRSDLFFS